MARWLIFIGFLFPLGFGCQKNPTTDDGPDYINLQRNNAAGYFSDSVTEFKVNVFFEAGATPYTGSFGLGHQTWDITKESYRALFSTHSGRTVSVPYTTSDMTAIGDQATSDWHDSTLLALAAHFAPPLLEGTAVNVSVLFLNGTYNGNAAILGIQFAGYPYAFVFKDVVISTGGGALSQRYVEQATVVHEVGHAVGLVNNGVPMVQNHEDSIHPKHSSNSECVMYWEVESKGGILNILGPRIGNQDLNLFGSQSLADGQAYHP